MRQDATLADRFDLTRNLVLLSGTLALVRLLWTPAPRDRAEELRTAGHVTGYRGSPLRGVDVQMTRARDALRAAVASWGEHHLQDPVRRCRGNDGRSGKRRRPDRAAGRARIAGRRCAPVALVHDPALPPSPPG